MITPLISEFLSHARSQVQAPLRPSPPPPESGTWARTLTPSLTGGRRDPREFPAPLPTSGPGSREGRSGVTRISRPTPAARPLRSPLPARPRPFSPLPPRPAGSVIRLLVPLSGSHGPVIRPWRWAWSPRASRGRRRPLPRSPAAVRGPRVGQGRAASAPLPRPERPREEVLLSVSGEGRAGRPEEAAPRTARARSGRRRRRGRRRGRLRAL